MGNAALGADQLAAFLLSKNSAPKLNGVDAAKLAQLYISEGKTEGVRGDLAFCQSCLETGYWKFNGDVKPEQNNFSGIGATGGASGASFPDAQTGVRAQIQHLKAYIYIPHDTLSEFAEETVCGVTLASYPDLFGDMDTVEYFRLTLDFTPDISGLPPEQAKDIINDISPINDFDYDVKRQQETVNGVTLVLLLVFYICFIIFCIFIRMNVKTELYYRRRELGYLRLFGVEKHRIYAMIMLEYASRIMCSCAFALVVYFAAIAIYAAFAHSFVIFNIVHVTLAMLCAASLYFATVASAIHASMKKSIRELITE